MMLAPDAPRAACADRLDLVDATFDRPGKAYGNEPPRPADLLERLCRVCPVAKGCFTESMLQHEWGVWAGTSPIQRTKLGARPLRRAS